MQRKAVALAGGLESHKKNQHTHAAQPMCEASPEQKPSAHRFNICKYGSPRGRKAGYDFKKAVDIARYLAADGEGERTEKRQHYPCERNENEALLGIDHTLIAPA